MTHRPSHPPEENVLALPPAWLRSLHPRRGGTPVPPPKGSRAAEAARLLAAAAEALDRIASGEGVDGELRDAARRYTAGEPDPVGAAVVAAAALAQTTGCEDDRAVGAAHRAFADRWRAEHGIGFAACALVEASRLRADPAPDGTGSVPRRAADTPRCAVGLEAARHVRRLLAAAPRPDYDDAVRRLAGHRVPETLRLVSYLVPTRQDWVDESVDVAVAENALVQRTLAFDEHAFVLCSLGTAAQAERLAGTRYGGRLSRGVLAAIVDGLGADGVALLLGLHDERWEAKEHKLALEAIALVPADGAFEALLDRIDGTPYTRQQTRSALLDAMGRFPVRALRLLAAAAAEAPAGSAAELLRHHAAGHADLAESVLPDLPDEARAAVAGSLPARVEGAREAAAEELPGYLGGLPWDRPVKPVVDGLETPASREIVWRDGEREEWLAQGRAWHEEPPGADWAALARGFGEPGFRESLQLVLYGPEEVVRPLLAERSTSDVWDSVPLRAVVARFGMDAYPVARRLAEAQSAHYGRMLLPYLDAEVALLMGGWLRRRLHAAADAREWLDRHGLAAVPLLAPAALGRKARPRSNAECALRRIAGRHGVAAVAAAVPPAADALTELLSAHPVRTGLIERPKLTGWPDPALLPPLLLRGRDRVLPPAAMRAAVELLALAPGTGGDGAGGDGAADDAAVLGEVCDPASLAEFGLALFGKWRAAGAPPDGGWALTQLARTGDDTAVPVLEPLIRAWPGEGELARAVTGLEVLAAIGSDAALTAVHGLCARNRSEKLRRAAKKVFADAAAARGLSAIGLADRLAPDLGLGGDGRAVLDYGPRRFVAGVDELLAPFAADETGARRKSLPKPGRKDDAGLAAVAQQRFAALKKDVRGAASAEIRRLEEAMRTRTPRTPAEFRFYAFEHPVTRHLARRVVWLAGTDEDGDVPPGRRGGTSFRIAEDGSLAGADDGAFVLPEEARIRVPHPVLLGETRDAWSQVFADYEILQPFPQLALPVFALTEAERDGDELPRLAGAPLSRRETVRLMGPTWFPFESRREPGDPCIVRPLGGGPCLIVALTADLYSGGPDPLGVRSVRLGPNPASPWETPPGPLRFGDLDPATVSDALLELTALMDGGNAV
ncbi:DUF4132 domain-containing protein [Actinomadura rifamycini]|uniref:DUF4132 domain-containing protein n=1 Tax=Actinomadura rifamycini TaxID=31962 RepID=UPI0003F4E9DE|nr:DUF4132 domain-containing protein [Actinomadura rifamycini]